jgi:hypothetical protein
LCAQEPAAGGHDNSAAAVLRQPDSHPAIGTRKARQPSKRTKDHEQQRARLQRVLLPHVPLSAAAADRVVVNLHHHHHQQHHSTASPIIMPPSPNTTTTEGRTGVTQNHQRQLCVAAAAVHPTGTRVAAPPSQHLRREPLDLAPKVSILGDDWHMLNGASFPRTNDSAACTTLQSMHGVVLSFWAEQGGETDDDRVNGQGVHVNAV